MLIPEHWGVTPATAILVITGTETDDVETIWYWASHQTLLMQWSKVMIRGGKLTLPFWQMTPGCKDVWLELPADCLAMQYDSWKPVVIPAPLRWLTPFRLPATHSGLRRWRWYDDWWDDAQMVQQHHHWIQFIMWWLRKLPPELVRVTMQYVY